MFSIETLASFLFLAMAFGLASFVPLVPTRQTGAGLSRVFWSTIAASSLLFLVLTWTTERWPVAFGVLSLLSLNLYFLKDVKDLFGWCLQISFIVLMAYISFQFMQFSLIATTFFLMTSALLGITTYTMLFGHWYLVTPKLSEKPLVIALVLFWVFFGVKLAVSSFSFYANKEMFEAGSQVGFGYLFNWIVVLMRFTWGYLILAILSYFAWKLVRMRSIQSATGVLYVMVFFVLIGEIFSAAIYYKMGLLI